MAPFSFRAANKGDSKSESTYSQSAESALSVANTPVSALLENKSGEIFSVKPDATVNDAVMLLREKRIGALLVFDDAKALVGILSERDIVRKMADTPGRTLQQEVSDLMTHEVVTCGPNETLVTLLTQMTEKKFRHMPVVKDGAVLGVVTIGDVVRLRLKELEYEALRMKQLIVG
ncbi:MAG: CBS domain-containing protein [Pseudomonadota bacterium]